MTNNPLKPLSADDRCDYQWPQSPDEIRNSLSDCDHACRLRPGHDGPHRCGDGAETP